MKSFSTHTPPRNCLFLISLLIAVCLILGLQLADEGIFKGRLFVGAVMKHRLVQWGESDVVNNTENNGTVNDRSETSSAVSSNTVSNNTIHGQTVIDGVRKCPGVLADMTLGHWKTRPLTGVENNDIIGFLTNAHVRFRFPPNYERKDRLCGNVTHTGHKTAHWFRALCDPRGITPCCYHNKCENKSVLECVCEECYDMRQVRHAEYSAWTPSHPACTYKEHSPQEVCDILRGSSVVFVGDSLVRHVYTAMLLVVTGDMKEGAMRSDVPPEMKELCYGMYMFTEKHCRHFLNYKLTACNGSVNLNLFYYFDENFGTHLEDLVQFSKEKSVMFTGIGIHSGFNETRVQTNFLLPSLVYMKRRQMTWPRIIWAASHAPGILKSPSVLSQTYASVKVYNTKMASFLKRWNIPVFDTFNLTDGMMSFDGEHYGRGMNIVKANILLSYIQEMRRTQNW